MAGVLFVICVPVGRESISDDEEGGEDDIEKVGSPEFSNNVYSPQISTSVSFQSTAQPQTPVDTESVGDNTGNSVNDATTTRKNKPNITDSPMRTLTRNTSYSSCLSEISSAAPATDQIDRGHAEASGPEERATGPHPAPAPGDDSHPAEVAQSSDAKDDMAQSEEADRSSHLILETLPIKERLKIALKTLGINTDVWDRTSDASFCQVSFIDSNDRCEDILNKLTECGIGKSDNSSVSVIPVSIHYEADDLNMQQAEPNMASETEISNFKKSIKARLTVAQVVENVKGQASLTFDYIMLLSLASIIAGLGLAESSSVVLVASMLISPLMGPILGGTFGTVIKNSMLRNLGIKTEILGLSMCVFFGFILGLISAPFGLSGANWGSVPEWPTPEMRSRGMLRSLLVGIMIALPSGAGVALSVLGGNAGSLVGVAISASLLPPAVNAGMLWGIGLVTAMRPPDYVTTHSAAMNESQRNGSSEEVAVLYPPNCPALMNNAYQPVYSCDMGRDMALLGLVSLTLTLLNILCIFITGVAVLKIKEVAPRTAAASTQEFWKNDIRVARETYKTMKGEDANALGKRFLQEWENLNPAENENETVRCSRHESLFDLLEEVEKSSNMRTISDRVPTSPAAVFSNQIPFDWRPKQENTKSSTLTWHSHSHGGLRQRPLRFLSQTEREDIHSPLLPPSVIQGNHPPGSPLVAKNKIHFFPRGKKKKHTFVVTKINEKNQSSKGQHEKDRQSGSGAKKGENVELKVNISAVECGNNEQQTSL